MKFSDFAQYLQRLESTSKRLEITSILAELLDKLSEKEIDKAVYMSQGGLKALFENPKFNMADKMVVRVLSSAYNKNKDDVEKMYGKEGDLGTVTFQIAPTETKTKLDISAVHTKLLEIAVIEGSGSQEIKVLKLANLLKELDALSAKFVVRIVLGTTRLGFTELTIINALAEFLGDKKLSEQIEDKYNMHPDLGLIALKLKTDGIKGIKNVKIETGVPILPQRAQRLGTIDEIVEKMGNVWAEFKFDGTRVQLHLDRKKKIKEDSTQKDLFATDKQKEHIFIKTYTRNLEDSTHQFPDLIEAADKNIKADSVILDGEAIGYNKESGEFLPFQEIMQRKRKHDIAEIAKEIPLRYFVFDLLYLNGESLMDKSLQDRQKLLKSIIKENKVIELSYHIETTKVEDLEDFFEQAKEQNLEGMMLKTPTDPYQAGARSFSWVKYKKADQKLLDDTIDVVILGYWFGKGNRNKFGIGTFLVGVYDEKTDTYKTFTKVGSGLTDEEWVKLREQIDKLKTNDKPKNSDVNKFYSPDVWVQPKIVVEIGGDEISKSSTHSAGFALRFPRLIKFRPDKRPQESTSVAEIWGLHNLQKRGYYNSNGTK
ncbi:MAG TPA: ATP-dependent DNA ligase [Candidatus Saccharimonadales bacterium]|nr:ATP-dependent DNA ligase [Candidatus Saccharimonadales bacterium]